MPPLRAVPAALLIGMLGLAGEACATTYHVETYGDDIPARNGSTDQPWKTLSYAATRAITAGDLIQIGAGTFEESAMTSLQPGVSLEGAGETQTIITSIANPTGSLKSWLISMGSWNSDIPVAGNQSISKMTLDGRAHTVNQAIGCFARSGVTFHDLTFKDSAINGLQIAGSYTPLLAANAQWPNNPPPDTAYCSNIQIYDCTFLNGAQNPSGAGWAYGDLGFNGVKDSVVRNCSFDERTYGGWGIKGSWFKNSNIHNCDVLVAPTDPVRGKDFSIEVWYAQNCQFFDIWANGAFSIGFNDNVRIHHNEIVTQPGENPSYAVEFGGNNSSVDHNWCDAVGGVVLWSGMHNDALRIEHNVFRQCNSAIFVRSNNDGTIYGDVTNLHIYNNTLDNCGERYNSGPIGLNAQGPAPITGSLIRNNIVVNTTVQQQAVKLGGLNTNSDTYASYVTGTNVTNNLFYNNVAGDFQQTASVSGTVSTPNTVADPLFKGGGSPGASPYYELQAGSPAIGAGVNVGLPFLGNAPDLGAFVQPIGQRIEAEMNYSVAADVGTNGSVAPGNLNLDSYQCIRLFDTGDTLRIHFKVPTAGYYDLGARIRSGSWTVATNSNHNPTGYFANGYSYRIDGVSAPFTGDAGSVSAPDSGGGGVYWGTMRSQGVYLPAGLHHVEIRMNSAWGFVDYLEVSGALAQGSHQDIGAVAAAGGSAYDPLTSQFTVTASGADIWNTSDEFHYVYQTLAGDGEIIARVASLTNTNGWAKAGVMIRDTVAANSAHAFMAVTPSNGAAFQLRTASGGASINTNGLPGPAPYWVRLKRVGGSFTGYKSADGVTWTQVGSATTVTMGTNVQVGLAVTSHNDGVIATGVFDSVQVIE